MNTKIKSILFAGREMGDSLSLYNVIKDMHKYKVYYDFGRNKSPNMLSHFDYIIWSHTTPRVSHGVSINVGHGFGFFPAVMNNVSFTCDKKMRSTIMLTYGKVISSIYIAAGHDSQKIYAIGMPFSVDLLSKEAGTKRSQFLQECRLDPDKKVVIYAPTWDRGFERGFFLNWWQDGKETERVQQFCETIVNQFNLNLIVRMHERKRYSQDWIRKYSAIFKQYNVHAIYMNSNYNNLPYFKYSDILVGDLSGVNTYFYVMNKPVVHIGKSAFEAYRAKGHGSMDIEERPGYVVDTFSDLLLAIEKSIVKPDAFRSQRLNLVDKYIDYVGQECQSRIIKLFEEKFRWK